MKLHYSGFLTHKTVRDRKTETERDKRSKKHTQTHSLTNGVNTDKRSKKHTDTQPDERSQNRHTYRNRHTDTHMNKN